MKINSTVPTYADEFIFAKSDLIFGKLDKDNSNELIVADGMNHVYPLYPIEEAAPACRKVFRIVMR